MICDNAAHLLEYALDTLHITAIPRRFTWNGGTPAAIDLGATVLGMQRVIELMMADGQLTQKDSFGFAMANPTVVLGDVWDDPSKLIAMVMYWGPDGLKYAANACRKIRPSARTGQDSETLRREHPELFRDNVESVEADGTFAWGDFPYGGATYLTVEGHLLLGAVSALPQVEDPIASRLLTGMAGLAMHRSDKMLA